MAGLPDDVWTPIVSFLQVYVLPYVIVLVILLPSIWFAFAVSARSGRDKARNSLTNEIRSNARVTKEIVGYADGQLSGEATIAPMPEYQTRAFLEFKSAGLMRKVPAKIAEEIETLYLNMASVNKAGARQEELAFGPAAAFPNAHMLRLENLTYLRDTAHNIIEPYQDRLKDTRF